MNKILLMILVTLSSCGIYFGIAYGIPIYENKVEVKAELLKNIDLAPQESVIINFSQPVLWPEKNEKIMITPALEFDMSWDLNNKRLIITPKEFWKPETEYRISYAGGRSIFLTKINKTILSFSTVTYPEVFNQYPLDGQKEVILDIENPIVVNFDKSTKDFYVKFVLDPDPEMAYENNSEKTQFKLMPKSSLIDGQQYKFEIYAKHINDTDDGYKKISTSFFTTMQKAPDNWEKDFTLRIKQAKEYTQAKITTGKYIDINIEQQIMSIFENGKILDAFLVSSGKRGMDTPKGDFKIYNKSLKPWSKAYSLYMPFWMAITPSGSHGIHELPEWPSGYKEGENHLGTPVSHGCVRLGIGSAKTVFEWAEIGTPVIVY